MSAPAEEAVGEVRGALDRAREANAMIGFAELQEASGLGKGDLETVLGELREAGEAIEDAPGEWRRPYDDELEASAAAEGEPVAVRVEAGGRERSASVRSTPVGDVNVELTAGVARALGPEALGKLVMAGLDEAESSTFVLRIS